MSVKWSQIPLALSGLTARVVLQGVTVEGHLLGASPEALEMLIEKTSDAKRYSKGQQTSLPRSDVTAIYAIRTRIRGRAWGTPLGLLGGSYAGTAVAVKTGGSAWSLLLIPAGTAVGYYVGKRADIKKIRIEILPDVPRSPPEQAQPALSLDGKWVTSSAGVP